MTGRCEICGMPARHRLMGLNVCTRCLKTYQPECPACGSRMIARRYGREIVFDCTGCDVSAVKKLGHTGVNPPRGTVLSRSVISEILDELGIAYHWQPEACELPGDWWLRAGSGIGGHGREWFLWHRDGRYTDPSVRTRRELRALLRKYFL